MRKKTKTKSGRKTGSMLDQYAYEIKEMLDSGCTYQHIADELSNHFDDVVNATTVSSYCRRRDMRSLVTQGCRNGRIYIPRCDECDSCKITKNSTRSGTVRVCSLLWVIVSRSVLNSPMDCPKREKGAVNEIKRD